MRSSILRHWRRGAVAAAGSLAFATGSRAACDVRENEVGTVEVKERPEQQWIEISQRRLADSFSDWSSLEYESSLRCLRAAYRLPIGLMTSLKSHLISEANLGLAGESSSMMMLPTFVNKRVTGDERGDFYALDLGGTNLRVLRLTLEGDGKVGPLKQAKFHVPDEIKKGSGEDVFGFLADSVASFLATQCGGNPIGELGFTFSFPTDQSAINEGKLLKWNKDYDVPDCIGKDVVALLQDQLEARGIGLRVCALSNDTVGTMEAAAYRYPNTVIGVILGTGTNAAYIEQTCNVTKWSGGGDTPQKSLSTHPDV